MIKHYENMGWSSISDNVITINADAYHFFYENDAFYSSLYNHVRLNSDKKYVIFKLVGDQITQEHVRVKLVVIAHKLMFGQTVTIIVEMSASIQEEIFENPICPDLDEALVEEATKEPLVFLDTNKPKTKQKKNK